MNRKRGLVGRTMVWHGQSQAGPYLRGATGQRFMFVKGDAGRSYVDLGDAQRMSRIRAETKKMEMRLSLHSLERPKANPNWEVISILALA